MNVIELLIKMVESKSETPSDGELLSFIAEYLDGFEAIRIDKDEVKNLFLYKKFGEGKHLCFAGHVDVVPSGDGWSSDPYKVIEKDGLLYGRGMQDMKSGVAAFTQAMKNTTTFNGTLSMLLTSDEEGPAIKGTLEVLKYLKAKNMLPDSAIVAEPTCETIFGDAIKVGRRGSINGILTLNGVQGHAAYPEKSINPINLIAPILPTIAGVNLDNGDEYFSQSKFVITDIRSGLEVTNVTPGVLKMMFNVRNSTATTLKDVKTFVENRFKEHDFTLEINQSSKSFMTDADSHIVKTITSSIKDVLNVETKHSTAGGTSDARYIAEFGIDVIEFGVINDTIHAPNERTSKEYVEGLEKVFSSVIKNY
ncbi:MAG: succinyl-diaminopimelate desuccinylase [Helicobacteraceae bacterium]|nr:succinyl-diaminopimelate desuccinylase [Helicobacteraceae bacterium]